MSLISHIQIFWILSYSGGAAASDEVLESPFADLATSPLEEAILQSGSSNQPLAGMGLGMVMMFY